LKGHGNVKYYMNNGQEKGTGKRVNILL